MVDGGRKRKRVQLDRIGRFLYSLHCLPEYPSSSNLRRALAVSTNDLISNRCNRLGLYLRCTVHINHRTEAYGKMMLISEISNADNGMNNVSLAQ